MNERKPISKSLRFTVLRRDGFKCRYCGATPPDVVLHLDHVLAVARGGTNDEDNLVTACLPCNIGKGVMSAIAGDIQGVDSPRRRPPIEFFWDRDPDSPGRPLRDARLIIRPDRGEDDAPWLWEEFNRYWARGQYATHGASTYGFSPYEAAMYSNEILHMRWKSFGTLVNFIDDLIVAASLGHLPQYAAPSILRATHYESVYERCIDRPSDYEDIADSVAQQALAAFKPFLDAQHLPWRRR